jgi:hypothetical protein
MNGVRFPAAPLAVYVKDALMTSCSTAPGIVYVSGAPAAREGSPSGSWELCISHERHSLGD